MQSTVEPSAAELVAHAREGHRESLDALASRFRPGLVRFLCSKTRCAEDAEDLAQEALMRAFNHLDRYDPRFRFSTWLYTIAGRLAINHGRAHKPAAPASILEQTGAEGSSSRLPDLHAGRFLWQRAEAILNEKQYQALFLRYARDCSVQEIAAEMKLSRTYVKVLLFRARSRLAKENAHAL